MTDVMSQAEIDQLLAAISAKEESDSESGMGKIRLYDFRRPVKFKKSAGREIANAFEGFAKDFGVLVEKKYGIPFHIHLASWDELTYDEFERAVPAVSNHLKADLAGKNFCVPVDFEFSPELVKAFLNKAFAEQEEPLSDKEQKVAVKKLMKKAYKTLQKNLPKANIECSFENCKFEKNMSGVALCKYSEKVLLLTFFADFKSKKKSENGIINFCLPYNREFLAQVESQPEMPGGKKIDSSKIKIPVYQTPKSIRLSLGEIRRLKVGDTVNFKTNEFIYIGEKNEN